MSLAIRPACPDDATGLSELMVRAIRHNNAADYPRDVIARLLARHTPAAVAAMIATRQVFVAMEHWRPVGTVALDGEVLRGLFVAVGWQGIGHATTLIRSIEALALRNGLVALSLRSSITAHGLYERLGYRTQSFHFDADGSTYLMAKQLRPTDLRSSERCRRRHAWRSR